MGLSDRPLGFRTLPLLMLWVACVSLTAALALGPGGVLQAQSTPPTTFHGTVTAPDGDVAGGLEVIATIDGVVCSEDEPALTLPPDQNGVAVTSYRVNVLSADARAGCGVIGAQVRFLVGGRMAQETGDWQGQPQELDLTLPAGPTEPEENPETTATPEEPVEPVEPGETPEGTSTPQEPVEPGETPEGTATPQEPVEPGETPEETATEATETVEPEETPEATATEAVETAEPEETPAPTEAAATEEATPTPEPTAAATPTPTPVATEPATEPTRQDEPAEPEESTEPEEPEPAATGEDDGGGVSGVVIALAVVAGLAMVGVGVFSWLGRTQPANGVQPAARSEPVIGAGPTPTVGTRRREMPSLSSVRDAIRSLFRRQ